MKYLRHNSLNSKLTAGKVYRRSQLARRSNAVDRHVVRLVKTGALEKVAPGVYYKPKRSSYGVLPPKNEDLVKAYLNDDCFLLFSFNDYNSLGLGLTQLYNTTVVYNHKRHNKAVLDGRNFDFRRPARGFPKSLTKEFLLVDLLNNLELVAEDSRKIKAAVRRNLNKFEKKKVHMMAKKYGKVSTVKFFEGIESEQAVFA